MGESFLVSRLSSLGDVVCTLPAACALKQRFPSCHITWIVDPRFSPVVESCAAVDTVIEYRPSFNAKTWPRFDQKFDVAFDMQGLFKSAVPVWLARADRKLGYHWQREGANLFTQPVLPDPSSNHIVDQYLDVVRAAGCEVHEAEFGLQTTPESKDRVSQLLEAEGVKGNYVIINATAAWSTKRWPMERFATLSRGIADFGLTPISIGTASDSDVNDELAAMAGVEVPNFAGKTGISELIALIAGAAAHVGGDTGSTHIAAAVGVPAVGLYSITNPIRSCPYGQIENCHYSTDSLAAISSDAVLATLGKVIRR